MLSVAVERDAAGTLIALAIDGHATDDPRDRVGVDVCAAVSALAQGMIVAVRTLTPDVRFDFEKARGRIRYRTRFAESNDYRIVTNGFLVAIEKLAIDFENYIAYADAISAANEER